MSQSNEFYLPENPQYTIFDSMKDSVGFTINRTLTTYKGNLCAKSSFIDQEGTPQPWHEFGNLEGVGWAANAVGGSYELYRYASYTKDDEIKNTALSILNHCLEAGFIDYNTGFITPYRDLREDKFYLNYLHSAKSDRWFCAGSMAKVAYQLLICSDLMEDGARKGRMIEAAVKNARWIKDHIKLAPNGWYPRRSRPTGEAYDQVASQHERFKAADGTSPDPQFDHSGDGLFIVQLMAELTARGLSDYRQEVEERTRLFVRSGGFYGSINHDTYDDRENVSYAVAFRVLRRVADLLGDKEIRDFAYDDALARLVRYEMREDRNGVATKGLLYMEESWDTAYLWENAEASLAYMEAYHDTRSEVYLSKGLTILRAIAKHHHGKYGFLTEGVDWNNHVGAKHHLDGAEYGDIKYTEPFLNNLHITEPTLYYLEELSGGNS